MKTLTRYNLSAKLETIKGFLDDPDTQAAVLELTEHSTGAWVRHGNAENYANNRVAKAERDLITSNQQATRKLENKFTELGSLLNAALDPTVRDQEWFRESIQDFKEKYAGN